MEWQRIETAPKDGEEVIIFDPTNRNGQIFTASFDGKYWNCSVEGRWAPLDDFYGDAPKNPTHWMPLPKAPK